MEWSLGPNVQVRLPGAGPYCKHLTVGGPDCAIRYLPTYVTSWQLCFMAVPGVRYLGH
jgi:hypothetical protein